MNRIVGLLPYGSIPVNRRIKAPRWPTSVLKRRGARHCTVQGEGAPNRHSVKSFFDYRIREGRAIDGDVGPQNLPTAVC